MTSDGGVPDPRPGEYRDDGSPVDPGVCSPHRLIILVTNALAAEGYDVHAALGSNDALLGATLLIQGLGLTPRVPGDPQ